MMDFHPCVKKVIKEDVVNNQLPNEIDKISEADLAVLLDNIVLNVMLSDAGGYWLLTPNRTYDFLTQHPASPNFYVNLLIHSPTNNQELFGLINTLNLVQPALSFLDHANKSKSINARFRCLNEIGGKPTSLASLERLADKKKSAFRGK